MDTTLSNAVSALTSESTALSTISTNIANTNTTGYKAVSTQFQSLLSGKDTAATTYNSTGGVTTTARQNVTNQGAITSTTTTTDMAIDGNGFFVVTDGTNYYYTRDGEFNTDSTGKLYLHGTNYYLTGWTTDTSGNVSSSSSSLSSLSEIDVDNYSSVAKATSTYSLSANLPSEGQDSVNSVSYTNSSGNSANLNYAWTSTGTYTDSSSGVTYNTYLVNVNSSDSGATLSDGSTSGQSSLTYSVTTDTSGNIVSVTGTSGNAISYFGTDLPSSIDVTDSSGNATTVDTSAETWSTIKANSGYSTTSTLGVYTSAGDAEQMSVTWTAAGNDSWIMTVSSPVDSSSTSSGSLTDSSGATTSSESYLVSFNSDGSLKSISAMSEMNGDTLSTAATDSSGNPDLAVTGWSDSGADSAISLSMGTSGSTSGLTQYNSGSSSPAYALKSSSQNGYEAGSLESVSVSSDGTVSGKYSNGQTVALYKVAVATFANANGLTAKSDTVYSANSSSGTPALNIAGQNGSGDIRGSSLESSTSDSTTQFSSMITAQQAYQAASQIITTTTSMYKTLLDATP